MVLAFLKWFPTCYVVVDMLAVVIVVYIVSSSLSQDNFTYTLAQNITAGRDAC